MSDYEPVLQLKVHPDLPADELWNAIEFIYLTLTLYGTSVGPHLFKNVTHPHIQRISEYVQRQLEDEGVYLLPKNQLQARAKHIVERLKTYCTVTLEEDDKGGCKLIVQTLDK